MNNYELTLILRIGDTLESLKTTVKDLLKKHNIEIQSEEEWGAKKLAYEIDREREGYYLFANVQAPPESIQETINDFRLEQRHSSLSFRENEKGKSTSKLKGSRNGK